MGLPDHYLTLGIPDSATLEEIRRAYRRLARQWHPDHHPGDALAARRFKAISEAHWVLVNTERRAQYDRLRRDPLARARAADTESKPRRPAKPGSAPRSMGTFFGQLFSGLRGAAQRASQPGQDLAAEIRIPFLVAIRGGLQPLTIKREVPCDRCGGQGAEPGTPVATCPTCRGQGQIILDQGSFGIARTCHACRGRGKMPKVACRRCHGAGSLSTERTLSLRIQPGIEPGTRLRIAGEGEVGGNGKPNGDLYVTVIVDEHPHWRRDGADIHSDMVIDLGQAILGATVSVETVDGPVSLRIPPGTQPETLFKLRGRGIPKHRTGESRGDHFVRVHIAVPRAVSADARTHFLKFAKSAGLTDRET